MQTNANSAAFPRALTKREAFAAQALAAIIAADTDTDHAINAKVYPAHAVRYADALLAALERKSS